MNNEREPRVLFHPDALSEPYRISVNAKACAEVLMEAGLNPDNIDKIKIIIGARSESGKVLGTYLEGEGEIIAYPGTHLDSMEMDPINPVSLLWLEKDLNQTLAHESKHAADDSSLNNFLGNILTMILDWIKPSRKWRYRIEERRARDFQDKFGFSNHPVAISVSI